MVALVAVIALFTVACKPVPSLGEDVTSPVGVLDSVTAGSGEVHVTGWAAEWTRFVDASGVTGFNGTQTAAKPTAIMVMINGQWVLQAFPADQPRPDVRQAFIDARLWSYLFERPGADYGFDLTVPAPPGEVSVCVSAVNQWAALPSAEGAVGDNVLLGCRTVTVS
jgi:hypothetical protein